MTFNECILVPLILKNQTIDCCETVVDNIFKTFSSVTFKGKTGKHG